MAKTEMLKTTKTAAPEFISRIEGSAKGLRVAPCNTVPDSPSAAPTAPTVIE